MQEAAIGVFTAVLSGQRDGAELLERAGVLDAMALSCGLITVRCGLSTQEFHQHSLVTMRDELNSKISVFQSLKVRYQLRVIFTLQGAIQTHF